MTSIFANVELAPRDPILGLNEQYNADTRSNKVNLGVGVYYDDEGRIPLLQAKIRGLPHRRSCAGRTTSSAPGKMHRRSQTRTWPPEVYQP